MRSEDVRSTLLLRWQPSASACNRRRAFAMRSLWPCLPMWGVLQKRSLLEVSNFKRRIASFHVAGVVLCDIPTCFITCRKSFLCTFASFSEDALHFSWQAQHFGDLHCHFAWQARHFRLVVLRGVCESHCQCCTKWVPWQM